MHKIKLSLPEDIFGELFTTAALSGKFMDGKALSDAIPKIAIASILDKYQKEKDNENFDIVSFYHQNFIFQKVEDNHFVSNQKDNVSTHIHRLWSILTRSMDKDIPGSSLIPLPNDYVVPGGRFNEIYYWDSYFTMLGLAVDGKLGLVRSMINNFAWLIDHIGFIPNGNRTYFLSRSQPPFFSMMVALLAEHEGDTVYLDFSDQLKMEYDFWMHPSRGNDATYTLGLNRYYDKLDSPRSEMYEADVSLSHYTTRNKKQLQRDLRAACESGWDFSSRWLEDETDLTSIHTTDIIPVDLNCLLYHLEITLAKCYQLKHNADMYNMFIQKAEKRQKAILTYCYDAENGYFFDYDFIEKKRKDIIAVSGIFPLCFHLVPNDIAQSCLQVLENELLKDGGIVSTNILSGQQWDSPNGWAPLQWMAYLASKNYSNQDLCEAIVSRWTKLNEEVFARTGKMMEKYNVIDIHLESGGGEYEVQDGFGWTNGVYLALKNEIKD